MEMDTSIDTSAGLPAGLEPASSGSSAPVAEPSVIEVDDNSLIKPKGLDKPIKYGEHVKGLQSQFTKASQRAAQLERELAARDARLQELERARNQATQQQPASSEDIYASLRELPYLTGEDAVNVVQSIGEQLRQRDMVLLSALKQMQQMQRIVSTLGETHSNQSFESKIQGFLQQGGYDPAYADLAKEIYLAYEGDDLDNEFPQIFASRVEQIEKLLEAKRASKLAAARKQPFVPGKGGQAAPSKPLQIKPNASPREIADELFGSWNESGT